VPARRARADWRGVQVTGRVYRHTEAKRCVSFAFTVTILRGVATLRADADRVR